MIKSKKTVEPKDAITQTNDTPAKPESKDNNPAKPQSKDNCSSTKTPASRQSPQGKRIESSEESISISPKKPKKKKTNKQTNKQTKGSDDPIQQHNRFSCLPEDMEDDNYNVDEKSKQGKITRLPTQK